MFDELSYEFQASWDEWGRGYKTAPRQLDAEGIPLGDKLKPEDDKKKSGNDKQKSGKDKKKLADDERDERQAGHDGSSRLIAWRPGPTR